MVPFFCLTVYIATKSKIESRAHYAPKKPTGGQSRSWWDTKTGHSLQNTTTRTIQMSWLWLYKHVTSAKTAGHNLHISIQWQADTCTSHHRDCSHRVNSLCRVLCLVQFSAADRQRTTGLHTSLEPDTVHKPSLTLLDGTETSNQVSQLWHLNFHFMNSVVSLLDSGAVGPGFKLQLRHCWVTVLGKLFTSIVWFVSLFTKQRNW